MIRLTSLLLFISIIARAQDYPHEIPSYPFIKYAENEIQFYGDSSGWEDLFARMDTVIFDGVGQISMLHMGGSHVQAGVFSSQMRRHLQTIQPGLNSFRGFLFPFRVARTNNPRNYSVHYTGSWESCRNVERSKACTLGLSGMSVTTRSPGASISINFDPDFIDQPFSRLRIYHPVSSDQYSLASNGDYKVVQDSLGGSTVLEFTQLQDSLILSFEKTSEDQTEFTLYGLQFENDEAGFAYHAVGVNGADVPAYLRCDLLGQHLGSVNPDVVIFGIGINDANTTRFNAGFYRDNYDKLIAKILAVDPETQFIFITNNDSYYRRRYPNENAREVREVMIQLAEKYNGAVWDLFNIMGGLDSISQWQGYGLAQSDKIHFTRGGYELVGDLFYSAFVKAYEKHLKSTFTN